MAVVDPLGKSGSQQSLASDTNTFSAGHASQAFDLIGSIYFWRFLVQRTLFQIDPLGFHQSSSILSFHLQGIRAVVGSSESSCQICIPRDSANHETANEKVTQRKAAIPSHASLSLLRCLFKAIAQKYYTAHLRRTGRIPTGPYRSFPSPRPSRPTRALLLGYSETVLHRDMFLLASFTLPVINDDAIGYKSQYQIGSFNQPEINHLIAFDTQ